MVMRWLVNFSCKKKQTDSENKHMDFFPFQDPLPRVGRKYKW